MKPCIKWVGGKRKEIKYFEKYIPNFNIYIEPFFGGGAVFWHLLPNKSIINDTNEHLINFYLQLRDNPNEVKEILQSYVNEKNFFLNLRKKINKKEYKDKIEQAAIFYYFNKTAFSGKWRLNSKGEINNSYGFYTHENFKNLDISYSSVLKNIEIYNNDFKEIMDKYINNKQVFIFLDPPYEECDTFYTISQEFRHIYTYIKDFMDKCECKVMLVVKSTNDIEELFKDYIVDAYYVKYSHNSKTEKKHKHLIITNYKV